MCDQFRTARALSISAYIVASDRLRIDWLIGVNVSSPDYSTLRLICSLHEPDSILSSILVHAVTSTPIGERLIIVSQALSFVAKDQIIL